MNRNDPATIDPRPSLPPQERLDPEAVLSRIVEAAPGFAEFACESGLLESDPSPSALLGALAAYLGMGSSRDDWPHREELGRCLDLIELLLSVCDCEAAAEVGASFLANLPVTAITSSLLLMGERTLAALEALEDDLPPCRSSKDKGTCHHVETSAALPRHG